MFVSMYTTQAKNAHKQLNTVLGAAGMGMCAIVFGIGIVSYIDKLENAKRMQGINEEGATHEMMPLASSVPSNPPGNGELTF